MSRARLTACALAALALLSTAAAAAEIDPGRSEVGFSLVTRWGEVIDGRFPVLEGRLSELADGRRQVRLALSAGDVEILGNLRHTHLTRGRGFFEADRYPTVTFVSDPFDPSLLVEGGALAGVLHIRDVSRREAFTTLPATCGRPAVDCPVLAAGTIDRADFGMTRWGFAIGRKVRFQLRIRVGQEDG